MAHTLKTNRYGYLRGGNRRTVSFRRFVNIAQDRKCPGLIVESVILPDLGEDNWGSFVIRENPVREIRSFRRK